MSLDVLRDYYENPDRYGVRFPVLTSENGQARYVQLTEKFIQRGIPVVQPNGIQESTHINLLHAIINGDVNIDPKTRDHYIHLKNYSNNGINPNLFMSMTSVQNKKVPLTYVSKGLQFLAAKHGIDKFQNVEHWIIFAEEEEFADKLARW